MNAPTRVRPPAVAGQFYPRDPATLQAQVDGDLARIEPWAGPVPKALVVPHAGYMYSGPVAATGYATLRASRDVVTRVVLLGPAHYVGVAGVAASSAEAFTTPLGSVPVDAALRDRVVALPGVVIDDHAHAPEHSLEVQIPFLQRVLTDFTVLPLIVGRAAPDTVAHVVDAVWGGTETLIVVSSDLSHYLDYATACSRDQATAAAVIAGQLDAIAPDDACGAYPLRALLALVPRRHLRAQLLDLRNSGDTAGLRDRVVGYGTFAFFPDAEPFSVRSPSP